MGFWQSKAFGGCIAAATPSTKIMAAFTPAYIAAGKPTDMAAFKKYDLEPNFVTVYFPPAATQLAALVGPTPYDKPSSEDIGMLLGDGRAWQAHSLKSSTRRGV